MGLSAWAAKADYVLLPVLVLCLGLAGWALIRCVSTRNIRTFVMELRSTLTCPRCGHQATETMPTDACQFFYNCKGCRAVLRRQRMLSKRKRQAMSRPKKGRRAQRALTAAGKSARGLTRSQLVRL